MNDWGLRPTHADTKKPSQPLNYTPCSDQSNLYKYLYWNENIKIKITEYTVSFYFVSNDVEYDALSNERQTKNYWYIINSVKWEFSTGISTDAQTYPLNGNLVQELELMPRLIP